MDSSKTRTQLRGSTQLLYDELIRRDIHVEILDPPSSLLEYTTKSGVTHLLFSTCSDKSSAAGLIIASSKTRTAIVADRIGIPIPAQITCRDIREVRKLLSTHGQIVIKPILGSGGMGVSTNIKTRSELERAYAYAKKYSRKVVAQQHVEGDDVRLLVVDGTFCTAVIRKPAHVIGNGHSTIKELINETNTSPLRNGVLGSSLMHIDQGAAFHFLNDNIHDIAPIGSEIRVVGPANVSLGGSLHEATHLVTSAMIADAEMITKKLGLGIAGVDVIWDRETDKHFLIEINATPGIDIHDDPFSGTSSNCVQKYTDWLIA